MAKNEVELTETEAALLHVAGQHLASSALPELGKAALEAQALYEETKDERFKELRNTLEQVIAPLAATARTVLETIPGVIIPTVEELRTMIADAEAEEQFLQLIKSEQEVLH